MRKIGSSMRAAPNKAFNRTRNERPFYLDAPCAPVNAGVRLLLDTVPSCDCQRGLWRKSQALAAVVGRMKRRGQKITLAKRSGAFGELPPAPKGVPPRAAESVAQCGVWKRGPVIEVDFALCVKETYGLERVHEGGESWVPVTKSIICSRKRGRSLTGWFREPTSSDPPMRRGYMCPRMKGYPGWQYPPTSTPPTPATLRIPP